MCKLDDCSIVFPKYKININAQSKKKKKNTEFIINSSYKIKFLGRKTFNINPDTQFKSCIDRRVPFLSINLHNIIKELLLESVTRQS